MTPAVLILRPHPGGDETAARARARGLEAVVAPLFSVRPLDWTTPPADRYEAVLFTSANAPRHGGEALASYRELVCYAVGEATAMAAREAGFTNVRTGLSDGAAVVRLMVADGIKRALHLTAPEPTPLPEGAVELDQVPVYISLPADRMPDEAVAAVNAGAVVLLHSSRAAELFSDFIGERRSITRVVAISEAAATAAGDGWAEVAVASEPRDDALLDGADTLCRRGPRPAPVAAPEPTRSALPHTRPRRRSWLGPLGVAIIAFLIGTAAMAWLLVRWEPAARYFGIVREPVQTAAPAPAPPVQPQPAPQREPATDTSTIVIDPDVARRVAQLEQRMSQIGTEAQAAVGNADRAEGLLVAFAARRALDRGVGLGYLEGLLRQRFGQSQPQAVGTIIAASRAPVTLQQLKLGLTEVGPQLTGAGPNRGFWTAFRNELSNLIIIRRGDTPSTDPRERLRRATAWLEAGQVEQALAEVLRMPGRENARPWVELAQRYVAARQALDTIEVAALLEPRMPPEGQATGAAAPAAR